MNQIPVTVIVPVKNEEKNLPKCLALLSDFSEVIVVDSNSTDRTPDIAKEFGYKLINFEWNGHFPKKRNWVLRNIPLTNEWVFFLDADEFITDDFIEEVRQAVKKSDYQGFWLRYTIYFMGKRLRFGDAPDKLALFRKSAGEYERIDEDSWSHLDMEVHEHPVLPGKIGRFTSRIEHNDFKGIEKYLERHDAYSTWEANRYIKTIQTQDKTLTQRQKIKYTLIKWHLAPVVFFIGSYFFKLGFLDGKIGFLYSWYKAKYFNQIQHKIKNLNNNQ
jgi:glycosyltransferase involved in cell wall biosynthesis